MLSFLPLAVLLPLTAHDPVEVPLGHSPGETSENGGWISLDETVSTLASSLTSGAEGVSLWGFVKPIYGASGDLPTDTGGDYSAVAIDAARLYFDRSLGSATVRLSTDFASGSASLLDAWARFLVTEGAHLKMGQFRTSFLRTANIEANRNLFILPTRNSLFYRVRDGSRQGAMLSIDHGPMRWDMAAQNGFDQTVDNLLISSRVELDLHGEGLGALEGAYGAPDEPQVTAGIAYSDDDSGEDGVATAADLALTISRFYLQLETVNYEAGYTALDIASGIILPGEPEAGRGDTAPISVTCSHLFPGDQWEAGARYERFDDVLGRKLLTVGFNRYYRGHDAKVQVNFSTESSSGDDADVFGIGLTLSF
ncbi:MAG: hypothetical protein OSB57_15655 [Planctomycetota bacterium]|nr:hypothetical protein [Planctomycetota bacterium]